MSKFISKSARKRIPMTSKMGNKNFYKGKGSTKEGHLTSRGVCVCCSRKETRKRHNCKNKTKKSCGTCINSSIEKNLKNEEKQYAEIRHKQKRVAALVRVSYMY